jgi:hypothetical protein
VRGNQTIYSYKVGSRDVTEKQGKTINMLYATAHGIAAQGGKSK